jgi:hypothetical protein
MSTTIPPCQKLHTPIPNSESELAMKFFRGCEVIAAIENISNLENWIAWLGYHDGFKLYLWKPNFDIQEIILNNANIDIDSEQNILILISLHTSIYFQMQTLDEVKEVYALLHSAISYGRSNTGNKEMNDNYKFSELDREEQEKLEKRKALGHVSLKRFSLAGSYKKRNNDSSPPPVAPSLKKNISTTNKLFAAVEDTETETIND